MHSIEEMTGNQVMGGYPDGTFHPDQPLTRAETVTIVNRMLGKTSFPLTSQATWRTFLISIGLTIKLKRLLDKTYFKKGMVKSLTFPFFVKFLWKTVVGGKKM
jgi:hypothetical protein